MRRVLLLALCFLALHCGDGGSETAEARAFFEQRYPYAEVLEVRETESEGAARSFVFRYRKTGQEQDNQVAIQFMEDPSTGRLSPDPEEPRSLP